MAIALAKNLGRGRRGHRGVLGVSAFTLTVQVVMSLLGAMPARAQNADAETRERSEISLTRTASSPATVQGALSKNVYRYVEHQQLVDVQVPYTVTVPYEDQEAYTETESYTDYETYTDYEQRCDYRPDRECTVVPRCGPVQSCHNVSDSVCRGEGASRTCTPVTRRECTTENRCSSDTVCRDTTRYSCENVAVQRSRPVTRYRDVTRYRTVTRMRDETRYRTEQQLQTVTDAIFDHQYTVGVSIQFPAESAPMGDEHETFTVALRGTEQAPTAEINLVASVFNYRVVSQTLVDRTIMIQLALVARYSAAELGLETVKGLVLSRQTEKQFVVRFEDQGLRPRVDTTYTIEVRDLDTDAVVFSEERAGQLGSSKVTCVIDKGVVADHDHLVSVRVKRSGLALAGTVDVVASTRSEAQLDASAYTQPNAVREFAIVGQGATAELVFVDAAPTSSKVDTHYTITLKRGRKVLFVPAGKKTLASAQVSRTALPQDAGGRLRVALAQFPGLSADDLRKHFENGDSVYVTVRTVRVSNRLAGISPVVIEKDAKVRVGR